MVRKASIASCSVQVALSAPARNACSSRVKMLGENHLKNLPPPAPLYSHFSPRAKRSSIPPGPASFCRS